MYLTYLLPALLALGQAHAVPPENLALALVVADQGTLDPESKLYMRYIWVERAVQEDMQALSLVVNYFGREAFIVRPLPLGEGMLMVLRIDLRLYAGRSEAVLAKMVKDWEEFQFDPKFNLLITKDTLKFLDLPEINVKVTVQERVKVQVKPYVWTDGKTYDYRFETRNVFKEVPFSKAGLDVARAPAEHIDLKLYNEALVNSQSQAPLVTHRYFVFRAMSSIKGKKQLFNTLYRGLYYDLAGIPRAGKKGTDLDALFDDLGVGSIENGIDFKKVFDKQRSDSRALVIQSGVTGKNRIVDVFRTLRSQEGMGLFRLTSDLDDEGIDIGDTLYMNLLEPKPAAHEGIFELANGLFGFVLYNGAGALAFEVPFDVANDTTVPTPHTQRLQIIGCVRCHAPNRGVQVIRSDIKKVVTKGFDIFNDIGDRKKDQYQALLRLSGLYKGDFERKLFPRTRDDYANAVLEATGPWKQSKDQTDVVQLASAQIGKIYNDWWYGKVDAKVALQELGIDPKADPIKVMEEILPPVNVVLNGVRVEDPRVALLKSGNSISRNDWNLLYGFAAARAWKGKK